MIAVAADCEPEESLSVMRCEERMLGNVEIPASVASRDRIVSPDLAANVPTQSATGNHGTAGSVLQCTLVQRHRNDPLTVVALQPARQYTRIPVCPQDSRHNATFGRRWLPEPAMVDEITSA